MSASAPHPLAAPTLLGKERSRLRALAHELRPVVQVGRQGLTDGLVQEVDAALSSHELIKIKIAPDGPLTARELEAELCRALSAASVQIIGHVLVLYRPTPKKPAPKKSSQKKPIQKKHGQEARSHKSPASKPNAKKSARKKPLQRKPLAKKAHARAGSRRKG